MWNDSRGTTDSWMKSFCRRLCLACFRFLWNGVRDEEPQGNIPGRLDYSTVLLLFCVAERWRKHSVQKIASLSQWGHREWVVLPNRWWWLGTTHATALGPVINVEELSRLLYSTVFCQCHSRDYSRQNWPGSTAMFSPSTCSRYLSVFGVLDYFRYLKILCALDVDRSIAMHLI